MFPRLEREIDGVEGREAVMAVLEDPAFTEFRNINVLPLIYDESPQSCNILVFDYQRAQDQTVRIVKEAAGGRRKHPAHRFYDASGGYICEVRYGDAAANALQRGLWTHTRNALKYFDSITGGWIDYSHNLVLVKLFSQALVSSEVGHAAALEIVQRDIARMKTHSGLSE